MYMYVLKKKSVFSPSVVWLEWGLWLHCTSFYIYNFLSPHKVTSIEYARHGTFSRIKFNIVSGVHNESGIEHDAIIGLIFLSTLMIACIV